MYVITKLVNGEILYYTGGNPKWSSNRGDAIEYTMATAVIGAVKARMVGGQFTIDPINF